MSKEYDVIIIGSGLAGLTQALMLGLNGIKTLCIDKQNKSALTDGNINARATVISYGSHQLFKAAGIWNDIKPHACPIKDIKIMDGHSPVLLDFTSEDLEKNEAAFGWNVQNHFLYEALLKATKTQSSVDCLYETAVQKIENSGDHISVELENGDQYRANLLIGADGRNSSVREWMGVDTREWSYKQKAIVALITHEQPHNNQAIEHFKAEGPFAVLPLADDDKGNHRSTIVWTQEDSGAALNYNDETFLIALNSLLPDSYGNITNVQKKMVYPLGFIHAYDYIKPRAVLIADAAHGIHPIAGQGLNLGLRDVAALTETLADAKSKKQDIGSIEVLSQYQTMRRPDNVAMAAMTDLLNTAFSNNLLSVRAARKIGLRLIKHIKPAKNFFIRQAMGKAGNVPEIIRKGKA